MRLRIGRPRSALIIAPHPDDEAIGAGHLMATLLRRGIRVEVVIVSDGAASHPASRDWPRTRLIAERRRESRRALRRLGLPAGALTFLGLPDGSLADPAARCRGPIGRELARRRPLALVVGPALDDDHEDHRAVARAVAGSGAAARRLAYRVWPPRAAPRGGVATLTGLGGHAGKRSLLRSYRTQLGCIRDDPAGFAIARHELAAFSHPVERFVEAGR